MLPCRPSRRVLITVLCLLWLGIASTPALAGGYDDKDLSLRFPAAFSRFASYGDVAGVGGASAGSMWSSSVNPASLAWKPIPGDLHLSLSPQYSGLYFREGTRLDLFSEALTWDAGDYGTFQPGIAQLRSNTRTTRQGLDFGMNMDYGQLQWAKRFGEDWAFGGGFNVSKSETRFDLGPVDISDSSSETYGLRVGALHRLADKWLGGVVFDYAFSPSRTTLYDFMGLGIGNTRIRDTTHQFVLRPGLSWEYQKDSSVYADYQLGSFSNDTGSLLVNRFLWGVDHKLAEGVFVRGGTALDTKGNASWTCGLGIYPTDRFSIDLAYQDNMFPELTPEFGRSRTLTLSLSFTF